MSEQTHVVTLDDIASRAGVSRMTVSRVLNNAPNVRPETRKKVQQAQQVLATTTVARPDSSIKPKRNHIGLLYDSNQADISSVFLQAALSQAQSLNFNLQTEDISLWPEQSKLAIADWCLEQRLRGVLLAPSIADQPELCDALIEQMLAVVRIEPSTPANNTPFVAANNHLAGYQLTRKLIEQGHQRIEFMSDDLQQVSVRGYYQGYLDATRNIAIDPTLLQLPATTALNKDDTLETAMALLKDKNRPSAIICHHYEQALIVVYAAKQLGLEIPRHLTVCCISRHQQLHFQDQRVQTISPPFREMAAGAVQLLIKSTRKQVHQTDYAQLYEHDISSLTELDCATRAQNNQKF
ncbi:LacI family transcriptional regulator [Neiella marina]|uniref:LacI family transcriptional regulator n=1 Tax=Neiella marina TaxID=508461 RepID=A0A8J2XQG8_9GAMM|nr:LacI family DNA-binding transcriptional regulator [Neiella marina]GGA82792.1 LacI family transcriptional regulator [Neiella marina]